VLPNCTAPKLTVVGLAARDPAVTPAPESGMLSDGFDALLATAIPPVTLPVLDGVNVAVKLVLCPPCNSRGTVTPPNMNPDPLGVIDEMVAAAAPPFVNVMVWD